MFTLKWTTFEGEERSQVVGSYDYAVGQANYLGSANGPASVLDTNGNELYRVQ
jgi:hypothetical protein